MTKIVHMSGVMIALLLASAELGWAQSRLFVSGYTSDNYTLFSHPGGRFLGHLEGGPGLNGPQAAAVGPDGLLYVASEESDSILRYDPQSGSFQDVFVTPGSGGLNGPTGFTWGPRGDLFVPSFNTDVILRYDGVTGEPLGAFVTSGSGSLDGPDAGTIFGPDGDLYVPSYWNNRILRYDGETGEWRGPFITGIARPRILKFRPDGLIYITSETASSVRRYTRDGVFVDDFVAPGSGGLNSPTGLAFDNQGFLFVASVSNHRILKYDAVDGSFVGIHVEGGTQGITAPTYLAFLSLAFVRGDSNADGRLSLADPLFDLGYLFNQGPSHCLDAQDFDDDGWITLADPLASLEHQFGSGPPAPAPRMACGPDPTSDRLDCLEFSICP